MAEETNQKPNDPNTKQSDTSVDNSQVELAQELNVVLEKVANKLEKIKEITKSQADMVVNMTQSFQSLQSNFQSMSNSSSTMSDNLSKAASVILKDVDSSSVEKLSESLEKVSNAVSKGLTSNNQSLTNLKDSVTDTVGTLETVSENLTSVSNNMGSNSSKISEQILTFRENTKDLKVETSWFVKAIVSLAKSIKKLMSGIAGTFKNLFLGAFGMIKSIISSVGSLVGAATQFVKFSLTVPFTIVKEAAKLGNMIRTDLVEIIQQSAEDLKENFDFSSDIGQGIKEMTSRGKGMLLAFQSPSNELVKLFGMGASGIANMIKEVGTNIAAMGHFSELFGRSIMGDEKRLKNFTKMVRGFGFSSEDIHYMALDAANNLEHINVRMARLGVTLETTAKEFGVDRKRLSKNFMIMRKNITQFGHLSDEEIAATTARLTQMRIKLEDAVAVFDKFKTFEDAANSVAILSQTFGMNLDAFDIIQAKNPEEIINMFRNSMLETGRAFEDLNRFEKDLMAQHTGMSAESLAALMHYRDLGLTHQEAVDKMASERPEAKQMASLKKLNSAIKEVQKIMTFDSPFKAFADGLANNMTLSGELKDVLVSLSKGYEGIYNYAKGLDAKTWTGLVEPINKIIRTMLGIFKSEAFKQGLVKTVEVISYFVSQIFNFDEPVKALQQNVKVAGDVASELNKKVKVTKDANEKNVGTLLTLSGRIMGGIIKGAAIGFTALLMTVNDGIDAVKAKMDKKNPYSNIIETFFGWDPGDVNKMGTSLKKAVTEFFSKSEGMISLTSWLLEGFQDIFEVVISIFGGALASSIDKIFGTMFAKKPSIVLGQAALKSNRMNLAEAQSGAASSIKYGREVDNVGLASMIQDLADRANSLTDPSKQKKMSGLVDSFKQRFSDEGLSSQDRKQLAQQVLQLSYGSGEKSITELLPTIVSRAKDGSFQAKSIYGEGLYADKDAVKGFDIERINPEYVKEIAKTFDSLISKKSLGGIKSILDKNNELIPEFNNMTFKAFWSMFGKAVNFFVKETDAQIAQIGSQKQLSAAKIADLQKRIFMHPMVFDAKYGLSNNPYFKMFHDKFIDTKAHNTALAEIGLGIPPKPSQPAAQMTKGKAGSRSTVPTNDLEFLNKYINISESKAIFNKLMDSVSLNDISRDTDAKTIASSNYSGAEKISINKSNRVTKQKVEEQAQKLEQIKKKLQEENIEISSDFVFTKEIIDKLMKTMAKNNLVRILGMPEFTNGVMSLSESALGSRCFNIGSDGTAPTIETIQPSGS